jgi:glycosyltransferase involved in cell wall biosynthesis
MNGSGPKRLCVVHGGVDDLTAINRIAMHTTRAALDAGWRVTVIAKELDRTLASKVEWRRLWVPPRLHAVQWVSARAAVKRAIDGASFDVTIGWQAQLLGLLDVYNCQYISEAARDHDGFAGLTSPKSSALRVQQELVGRLEARRFRSWDQRALMIYSSLLIKREFEARYPTPTHQVTLPNFGPVPTPASAEERARARNALGIASGTGPVLAFLGGWDTRKGVIELVDALRSWPAARLLVVGPDFGARPARVPPNVVALGRVDDVRPVLAAADVVVVPSRFDPFAVVVLEAGAVGTPVVVTPEVGAADEVVHNGAGLVWNREAPLRAVVDAIIADRPTFSRGAVEMATRLSAPVFRARLVELLAEVASRRHAR